MIFRETKIKGVYLIDLEKKEDLRGFNARNWCQREFAAQGLVSTIVQGNVLFNRKKGTLRGMHYQAPPHAESKVFRCVRGAIFDVVIDLRPDSPTFEQWVGVELRACDYRMLYIPENCAQGFITLEDDTELLYLVSAFYAPESERGVRFDDPAFSIRWPLPVEVISEKDQRWAPYAAQKLASSTEAPPEFKLR